jgi:hypothetical protein
MRYLPPGRCVLPIKSRTPKIPPSRTSAIGSIRFHSNHIFIKGNNRIVIR